jgi:DNA-binding transcriptional ArsR family regulator
VMKHLAVLRDAGLVQTLPEGRRRRHYRVERGLEPLRKWMAEDTGGTTIT